MICAKCKAEIPDNAKFCTKCGAKVEAPEPVENVEEVKEEAVKPAEEVTEPTQEAPAESAEPAAPEAPAPEASGTSEPAPKKKFSFKADIVAKISPKALIIVAAVIVAAIVLTRPTVLNGLTKLFLSDEKYYQHVEKKAIVETASDVIAVYDDYLESVKKVGATAEVEIEIGKSVSKLIKDLDLEYDFSEIKKAGVKLDTFADTSDSDNPKAEGTYSFTVNGKDIASMTAVIDDNSLYGLIPELSKKYVLISDDDYAIRTALTATNTIQFLPYAKEYGKYINKYVNLAIKGINKVSVKDAAEESIGDVSKKLTKIKVTFNEKVYESILESVAEELAKDKGLAKLLAKSINDMNESGEFGFDQEVDEEDILDVFEAFADDAERYASYLDEFVMNVYVDSKGDIVGREFEISDNESFSYLWLESGSKYGGEIVLEDYGDEISLSSEGKLSSGRISGEVKFKYDDGYDNFAGSFDIAKVDIDELKKGHFTGEASLDVDKFAKKLGFDLEDEVEDLADELSYYADIDPDDIVDLFGKGLVITISADTSNKGGEATIKVSKKNEDLLVLKSTSTVKNGGKISAVKDSLEVDEWLEDVDFSKILSNLKKAGFPSDFVSDLEDILEDGYDFY